MKYLLKSKPWVFKLLMNLYPPFIGAGIRVTSINKDVTRIRVRMNLTWYNRNVVGTQFGGSLYAMTDPFFMLILIHHLGDRFVIWDKSASISFIKPGRGTVYAEFNLSQELIAQVAEETIRLGKYLPTFPVEIVDAKGDLVAKVEKELYLRVKENH